ncbi:YecR family lipoprotein [Xanthomonas graminis]|uniref:YecR family lipoprotein n=2 Tax=Xanthomonas graminis TaxID=3390026 RepID=UPI0009BF1A73
MPRGFTMKLKFCGAAAVVLLVGACATHADWQVAKMSRADGVIALSYERNEFQRPDLSEQEAVQLAAQKCRNWGYKGAEPFGSQSTECLSRRGFGNCGSRRVTVEFQCTGSPSQQ